MDTEQNRASLICILYNISIISDLAAIKYEVIVYTGDVSGAGTNANVWITVFGEHGDSGKRPLKQSFRNLFEKNQMDKFTVECLDLGIYKFVGSEEGGEGLLQQTNAVRFTSTSYSSNIVSLIPKCCQLSWLQPYMIKVFQ